MTRSTTGEDFGLSGFASAGQGIVQNTNVHDARCEFYDLTYERSGVMGRRSFRQPYPPSRKGAVAQDLASNRYALRKYLDDCRTESRRMLDAAKSGEMMEVASAGMALMDCLQELWKLRSVREDEWGALLNFLQASLAKEDYEKFTFDQCQAVHTVVTNYLAGPLTGDDDVSKARRVLQVAGLDPWKAISARKGSE